MSFQQNSFQQNAFQIGIGPGNTGPFGAEQLDSVSGRDSRRYQLGGIDVIPNLLLTTLAVATVVLRGPIFAQKQDLSNPRLSVRAEAVVNRLPLGGGAQASPFLPHLSEQPTRPLFLPADTSRGTPKTLFEDVSFAPAQSEFQTIPWPKNLGADTSFRNTAILNQEVAAPFVLEDFSNIQWRNWLPLDTSKGSATPLLNPNPFWGSPQVSAPVFNRTLPDTSQSSFPGLFIQPAPPFIGYVPPNTPAPEWILPDTSQGSFQGIFAQPPSPFFGYVGPNTPPVVRILADTSQGSSLALLTTPVAKPFGNDTYNVTRPPFNVTDTSKGSPLPLLSAPVFPPFYQTDFPSPIEYRLLTLPQWAFFGQNPDLIPPAPPPVVRVEIDGGVPRKKGKSPKQEIGEIVDATVTELWKAPEPIADLPKPLRPVARVVEVPVYIPPIDVIPLDLPAKVEEESDEQIIAMLTSLGIF